MSRNVMTSLGLLLIVSVVGCTKSSDDKKPLPVPTGVWAIADASGQIALDWAPVDGATGYNIYWATAPGVTRKAGTPINVVAPPYTHTGIADGTTYFYVVTTLKNKKESKESAEVFAQPIGQPSPTLARSETGGEIIIEWGAVGGATAYNIYWGIAPGVTRATGGLIADVTSPYTHTGRVNGTQPYYYVVTALNDIGGGAESTESTEVTALPLDSPTAVWATAGTSEVTLTWNLVTGADDYTVYYDTSPGVDRATGTPIGGVTSPYAHTGLADGQTYYYVLVATNTIGGGATSAESTEANAMPQAAPTGLTAESPSSGEVEVTWAPTAGATSYDIYWSNTVGVTKATGTLIADVASPYLHAGLTDGVTYYYVLVARNTTGGGAESVESAEAACLPIAPPMGVAASGGTGEITVTWAPVTGATSYAIYWGPNPGVTTGMVNLIPDVTSPHVHSPLSNGQDYFYAVVAANSVGGGAISSASQEVFAMPLAAPTGVLAAGGSMEVTIDWQPVAGAAAYDIYWSTTAGVTKATGARIAGATAPYDHTGIDNRTTYYYVVAARNTVGGGSESVVSAEVFGTPDTLGILDWVLVHENAGGGFVGDVGMDCVLDGAGNILVAGYSESSALNDDMVIWRILPDGTLDPSFNGQGWIQHDGAAGGLGHDRGRAIALDGSGRILVAGSSLNAGLDGDLAIWRYNPTGNIDTTFGGTGYVTHDNAAGGAGEDGGEDMIIDPTGNIIVTGFSETVGGAYDMVIWKYTPGGPLDATFNGQGYVTHNDAAGGNGEDYGQAVTLDASGRILIAGGSTAAAGDFDMALWRYDSTGALDGTFGTQGWVTHHDAAGGLDDDFGQDLTVDPSGRILVSGSSLNANWGDDMVTWRYLDDGSLDLAFDFQGYVTHNNAATGNSHDRGMSITLDGADRIIVAGSSLDTTWANDMVVWRYDGSGTLDGVFGGQGWFTHDSAAGGGSDDIGESVLVDGAGRIVIAGRSRNSSFNYDLAVWRVR